MVSGIARARKSWSAATGAVLAAALAAALASAPATAGGRGHDPGTPGAPGAGDPYFPLDGNGGYDVRHYDLDLAYDPADGVLDGVATISARATQALSWFDLDLVGMDVERITVDGARAGWTRDGQELQVTPRRGLRDRERFTVRVTYSGVPQSLEGAGFVATDDGFVVAGQPHGAAGWFPANDHPTDTASYRFRVTVPTGLEAVANGHLEDVRRHRGRTTWTWHAREPMASYLTTVDVGEFELDSYREDGIRYVDAVDPDLYTPITPTTGERMAISQAATSSYKRLVHTIDVPAGGATVDFTVHRAIESDWDFFLVEAHTVGQDDWTTLPDTNGHTTQETGNSCLLWPDLHPFLSDHYLTVDQQAGSCEPTGATGEWWAATGLSLGPEQWQVDLSRFAGSTVELALTTVGDDLYDLGGAFVDDVVVSTGQGSTSFEDGLGTWTVPGAPAGSPGNENDWVVGTAADAPPPIGTVIDGSLARQPEVIDFLEGFFGRYPFRDAGGIVDDVQGLGFALETQTRPIYALDFFSDPVSGDAVVVHELAHQWYGDSLTLERWRDIWLNEGFATYAEWLWSEAQGLGTAQENFDFFYADYAPADDPWWDLLIGDPGPSDLFAGQVYLRGAMTVHALRLAVGDDDFFRILRTWPQSRAGDHVTTPEFVALAERISGEELDPLFQAWLYTPGRPALPGAEAGDRSRGDAQRGAGRVPPAAAASLRIAGAEGRGLTAP